MLERDEVSRLVSEVLDRLALERPPRGRAAGASRAPAEEAPSPAVPGSGDVVHPGVDAAVSACSGAQAPFQELGLEARGRIIDAMRRAALSHAERLARLAAEETGMGRWQDKVRKNILCATKTPGTEDLHSRSYTGDKGLTLVEYAPYGVVAAVTPSTNPTATVIHNAISILSAGNGVVFAPHPSAARSSMETMRALHAAAVDAGAPSGIIATMAQPSQEATRALLAHPQVRVNMVTGGPAVVKVAMTIGKTCKTIAAGPGNPPVVVDETADFPACASHVVFGASFDNCVLCTGEKEVIVTQAARGRFLEALRADPAAFELSMSQLDRITRLVIVEGGRGCKDPRLNRDYVGKDAAVIARAAGLEIRPGARLLWAETPNDHPLVWTEQLMPLLPVTAAKDVDAAIELAYEAEGGNHHTAAMHSRDVGHLTRMARRMRCSIFVKNAPTLYGLGLGEGYASMSIGTPTGDGLTKTSHFARPLQCSLVGYFRIA